MDKTLKILALLSLLLLSYITFGQKIDSNNTVNSFQKRILESTELDIYSSYYQQTGSHASVTGGIGTEELTNTPVNIAISIPVKNNNILKIDGGVSAYSSASSSNLNPFDGDKKANPNIASSGASKSDELLSLATSYSHYSKDRNHIISLKASISKEHDYSSIGFGGNYSHWFNNKNTSLSLSSNIYMDKWHVLYPYELGGPGGDPETGVYPAFDVDDYTLTGNLDYNPSFTPFSDTTRTTYAFGLGFTQILNKRLQGSLSLDVISQSGLLANHMQRVYFRDLEDSFIEDFHLADDVERLPENRLKWALSGRLNYYVSEFLVIRSFYRFYKDDWGINSNTIQFEFPIKPFKNITFYPSIRFYNQTKSDYFKPYNEHLSTDKFYTSDYDLAEYNAIQYGLGFTYTDPLTRFKIGRFKLKKIELKYDNYRRNIDFNSSIISGMLKFIIEK